MQVSATLLELGALISDMPNPTFGLSGTEFQRIALGHMWSVSFRYVGEDEKFEPFPSPHDSFEICGLIVHILGDLVESDRLIVVDKSPEQCRVFGLSKPC